MLVVGFCDEENGMVFVCDWLEGDLGVMLIEEVVVKLK